ncbi:MAG TPA: porin [Vicinamibacterales bacterium]
MTRTLRIAVALGVTLGVGAPALAQQPKPQDWLANIPSVVLQDPPAATEDKAARAETPKTAASLERTIGMQYIRPQDQRGLNIFETTKVAGAEYDGVRLDWGASFTTQIQDLSHSNTAVPVMVNGVNANQLQEIGFGFNNSTANLYLHSQLAPGMRVMLSMYLSSRHHNEAWVKDGYLQIDESPIEFAPLQALMQFITLKAGHMEINYGDAHFRRSDNGNAMFNPFVGNYIMDAFTTEIGAEVYLKPGNWIAMGAVTGGEVRGTVLNPSKRGPAFIGKLGYDRQINPDLRVRLTGSAYKTNKSNSNTLYGGDRAGSRYYWVLENTTATETGNFRSGLFNPGFANQVTAMVINPFVKVGGLELFGVIERAEGRASVEAADRTFNQYAVDAVYRFLPREQLFVGGRYNTVSGQARGIANDVSIDRYEVGGGWFITPSVLVKAEYVNQKYNDFPANNILNGGKFKGFMLEGVIGF